MTLGEAYEQLSSADTDTRLRAARFLAMNATGGDRRKLRAALKRESVPWVKRALERAILRAGRSADPAASTADNYADPPQRLILELKAKAIDEVAGTIVHELAAIVGSLKLCAPRDVGEYSGTRTENLVNSLDSLLAGIRNLKSAASRADYSECDLACECREACDIFAEAGDVFRFGGPSPFLVEIDPNLFKLALTNIIRNAIEAVATLPEGSERLVTLNWGRAGQENWVSVIDSGNGFERDPASMLEFGQSTKSEHIGFGLGTAKQAMQTMEGDVYATNSKQGGARIELRWFSNDENTIR
ncbi:sensor histidine kinase [Hyphomonas oceanitis]|uniref:Two-component sensor histidine kinase protein n=1 Tax=Hyphomonas oceanitis SCH89 TaxID=1280953 RepID=A0A059G2N1_9PROT|nr:HAMP domain-containing sensor histidine kinase [Hyphomonas oceanitis]KDA01066.1 two-component sensor histidine kinase protein [Hyphomonas oceanitis SCH89]